MLATGGSIELAVHRLRRWGVPDIRVVSIIASQRGIDRIASLGDDVKVFVAAIDPTLDDRSYIVPGLGGRWRSYLRYAANLGIEKQVMRVLSGIQPTGRPHWGNFFGAIRQYIDLQTEHDGFYFIADLHALTTVRDAKSLRQNTIDAAHRHVGPWSRSCQSHAVRSVPCTRSHRTDLDTDDQHSNGLLERCHAYKDKKAKGLNADAGLFTYPVLMAADILAYDSEVVPVGQDQVQHIEVCRDLAGSFNHEFGETFKLPNAKTLEHGAKVPGTDGEKMSKSYNNTLPLFGDIKAIRKQIMRIVTDARPMEEPKDPETDHLFQLYRLFAGDAEVQSMAEMYRRGGFGYGEIKKAVAESSEAYFADARAKRTELEANVDYVHQTLKQGAERARKVAASVVGRAKQACGLTI